MKKQSILFTRFYFLIQCLWIFASLWVGMGCNGNNGGEELDADGNPIECADGNRGCACTDEGTCDAGLICHLDMCEPCRADFEGCPCILDGCEAGLICDPDNQTCRIMQGCEEVGCAMGQFCEMRNEDDPWVCVDEQCEPGFRFNEEAGNCEIVVEASCDENADGSIFDDCNRLNRTCEFRDGDGAFCGDCFVDHRREGSMCQPIQTCDALGCAGRGRSCQQGIGSLDSACGACAQGFNEQNDVCVAVDPCAPCDLQNRECEEVQPEEFMCGECLGNFRENAAGTCERALTCNDLQCEAQNRVCLQRNEPVCAEECLPGFRWDQMERRCVAFLRCADLECAAGEQCFEGGDDFDAECGVVCPFGQGWNSVAGACRACVGGFSPRCDNVAGSTGRVVVDSLAANPDCLCEPLPGYFPGSEGDVPEKCDLDGDGWINDGAQPYLDSNEAIKNNLARCKLREITHVILRNERGESILIGDSDQNAFEGVDPFNPRLPLYESARNDGQEEGGGRDLYGQVALMPKQLNSLTKACVSVRSDFNDNGAFDVSEWRGSALGDRVAERLRLRNYYEHYARFSYFLEMYDGWYEPRAGFPDEAGTYVIRERPRLEPEDVHKQVSMHYPEDAFAYSLMCTRFNDAYYSEARPSEAGGDFSRYALRDGWGGMTHHSQYKCVHLQDVGEYENASNLARNPERVFKRPEDQKLRRIYRDPNNPLLISEDVNDWKMNVCGASDGQDAALPASYSNPGVSPTNPEFPVITCALSEDNAEEPGRVYWVVVEYENYAPNGNTAAPPYKRGCINECKEYTVAACPNYDELAPEDSLRFQCDNENKFKYGILECGCGKNYGGFDCEIGCPDEDVRWSENYSIETRDGHWMCGGIDGTEALYNIEVGDFTFYGFIPASSVDGGEMSTDDGEFTLRSVR